MPKLVKVLPIHPKFIRQAGSNIIFVDIQRATRLVKTGMAKIIKEDNPNPIQIKPKPKSKSKLLSIDIVTPYSKQIAKAYNDYISHMYNEWVLFIDWDVMLLNPLWINMCTDVLQQVGIQCGWLTCYTNRIGCKLQVAPNIETQNHDILYHRKYAKTLYEKNGNKFTDITTESGLCSGMFILTSKTAWKAVGGFNENLEFFGVDNDYHRRLREHGLKIYRLDGLYVYHAYLRETLKPYFKER